LLESSRYRIAFFSEDEALSFIQFAVEKGASEVICNDFSQTSLAQPTRIKKPQFRHPLRPISEIIPDNQQVEVDMKMPTQVRRRKSTGSSDIEFVTPRTDTCMASPDLTSGSTSPGQEQQFQRRNSMTTRSRRGSAKFYVQLNKGDPNSSTQGLSITDGRMLRTKESHMSLGSDAMSVSDDEIAFESDDSSMVSPTRSLEQVNPIVLLFF
jgi:hypothetical protein